MVLKQKVDFAHIMSCQPQVALENIFNLEAQGDRLIYSLILRGEPKLPNLWKKTDGHYIPKDFIRDFTIRQPGRTDVCPDGLVYIPLHLLNDVLTAYGVLDGIYWDGCRLRAMILVQIGMETGPLLGPSDQRLGPEVHTTTEQLRDVRLQSTTTRRPPSFVFNFQRGRPMRTQVIEIPGFSHSINPEEHVWNQVCSTFQTPGESARRPISSSELAELAGITDAFERLNVNGISGASSLSDKIRTSYISPMAGGMKDPLSIRGAFSTTSEQSPRRLSISSTSSPSKSMYQSTPLSYTSPMGDSQANWMTESCSSSPFMSSARPHRPIIDGSLKSFE